MAAQQIGNGHLDGRVVVVTGAGGGFGQLDRRDGRGAGRQGRARRHRRAPLPRPSPRRSRTRAARPRPSRVDVRDLAQVQALVARAVERFGAVDVMVNNAGIMPLAFFADHAAGHEAWDRCIDINFKGVLNGICAVHDQMIEQGRGHVVNISSIYANAGTAGSGVYSATKAAVAVLSDSLRSRVAGEDQGHRGAPHRRARHRAGRRASSTRRPPSASSARTTTRTWRR